MRTPASPVNRLTTQSRAAPGMDVRPDSGNEFNGWQDGCRGLHLTLQLSFSGSNRGQKQIKFRVQTNHGQSKKSMLSRVLAFSESDSRRQLQARSPCSTTSVLSATLGPQVVLDWDGAARLNTPTVTQGALQPGPITQNSVEKPPYKLQPGHDAFFLCLGMFCNGQYSVIRATGQQVDAICSSGFASEPLPRRCGTGAPDLLRSMKRIRTNTRSLVYTTMSLQWPTVIVLLFVHRRPLLLRTIHQFRTYYRKKQKRRCGAGLTGRLKQTLGAAAIPA